MELYAFSVITQSFIEELGREHFEKNEYRIDVYAHPNLIKAFYYHIYDRPHIRFIASEEYKDLYSVEYITHYGNVVRFIESEGKPFENEDVVGVIGYERKKIDVKR